MNVELAQKVLDLVKKYPKLHDQTLFVEVANENGAVAESETFEGLEDGSCGTVGCLAGHAALLSGFKFRTVIEKKPVNWQGESVFYRRREVQFPGSNEWVEEGDYFFEQVIGVDTLGLSEDEAEALFYTFDKGSAIELLEYLIEENS